MGNLGLLNLKPEIVFQGGWNKQNCLREMLLEYELQEKSFLRAFNPKIYLL